ncbi:MAG: formylmethanofuran dehydrogenase subunit E family protein [Thermoguttaceae bacterium]
MQFLISCLLLGLAACCSAEEPVVQLPKPKFKLDPSDPAWLGQAVQLHGHLGPWLVAGLRIGASGLRAVGAEGYFDVDITVEGPLAQPPQACFLNGLQVATGATLGKRNLKWVDAPRLAVRVNNVRSGKMVVVRPSSAMMEWIASAKGIPLSPANPNRSAANPNRAAANPNRAAGAPGEEHKAKDPDALDVIARKIAKAPETEILTISNK